MSVTRAWLESCQFKGILCKLVRLEVLGSKERVEQVLTYENSNVEDLEARIETSQRALEMQRKYGIPNFRRVFQALVENKWDMDLVERMLINYRYFSR